MLIPEPACPTSSLVTVELPAFTDRNGKKHNARYCYTSAKNGVVRWAHAGSGGQRSARLLSTNQLFEEAPLSYLQHLEAGEPKYYAELVHATFDTTPTGTMQKVFSVLLAEHLSCADKRKLILALPLADVTSAQAQVLNHSGGAPIALNKPPALKRVFASPLLSSPRSSAGSTPSSLTRIVVDTVWTGGAAAVEAVRGLTSVIKSLQKDMRSAAKASEARDVEAAALARSTRGELLGEFDAVRETIVSEARAIKDEVVDAAALITDQLEEAAALARIEAREAQSRAAEARAEVEAQANYRKEQRVAQIAEKKARLDAEARAQDANRTIAGVLVDIKQDTVSTKDITRAAAVQVIDAAAKMAEAAEVVVGLVEVVTDATEQAIDAAAEMSAASKVVVRAGNVVKDAAEQMVFSIDEMTISIDEIKSGEWLAKVINPLIAGKHMVDEEMLQEALAKKQAKAASSRAPVVPAGVCKPSRTAATSARGKAPAASAAPSTRSTRSSGSKPAPPPTVKGGKTAKGGKAVAGTMATKVGEDLDPSEDWLKRIQAAGETIRMVINSAVTNDKLEETLKALGEGIVKAISALECQVVFAILESLEYVFDQLGPAVGPLLLCGAAAKDGTVLDALLKAAANPKTALVREAAQATAVHLIKIAPSEDVLKVVLRVGCNEASAAKTCVCAAELLSLLVTHLPKLPAKLSNGVELCLIKLLQAPQEDVRKEGANALMCFSAVGCSSEALAIIDKVTVDNMPLRNQLLKQLGTDAA